MSGEEKEEGSNQEPYANSSQIKRRTRFPQTARQVAKKTGGTGERGDQDSLWEKRKGRTCGLKGKIILQYKGSSGVSKEMEKTVEKGGGKREVRVGETLAVSILGLEVETFNWGKKR